MMRDIRPLLVALMGLTQGASLSAVEESLLPRQHVANISAFVESNALPDTVLKAMTYIVDPGHGSGSGIFISPRHVLTAAHVVVGMDCDTLKVMTMVEPAGDEVKVRLGGRQLTCEEILLVDEAMDLAVMVTKEAVRDFAHLASEDLVKEDLAIASMGYTVSGHFAIGDQCKVLRSRGVQRAPTPPIDMTKLFEANCYLTPGMSGGPVFVWTDPSFPQVIGVNSMLHTIEAFGDLNTAFARPYDMTLHKDYKEDFESIRELAGDRWLK